MWQVLQQPLQHLMIHLLMILFTNECWQRKPVISKLILLIVSNTSGAITKMGRPGINSQSNVEVHHSDFHSKHAVTY